MYTLKCILYQLLDVKTEVRVITEECYDSISYKVLTQEKEINVRPRTKENLDDLMQKHNENVVEMISGLSAIITEMTGNKGYTKLIISAQSEGVLKGINVVEPNKSEVLITVNLLEYPNGELVLKNYSYIYNNNDQHSVYKFDNFVETVKNNIVHFNSLT